MEAKTHGVMVAGVSSCISAAWIRKQTISEYDPEVTPPALQTRLRNRTPLAIAGLGFTGLSAVAAKQFDKQELAVLADPEQNIPAHKQLNNHRVLHSIPYVGGAVVAAHLIKNAAVEVGQWLADKLDAGDVSDSIINHLKDLSEYVINSLGTGIIGHILGDLPTKSPLRFLRPIIDHNFAINLFTHDNPKANLYFQTVGWILTGGAWALSGLYIASWEPPERQISRYIKKLTEQDSPNEAIQLVRHDISGLFGRLLDQSRNEFWSSALFKKSNLSGTRFVGSAPLIDEMYFDSESIWSVKDLSGESLVDGGILPRSFTAKLDEKSIYSQPAFEIDGRISIHKTASSGGQINLFDPTSESGTKSTDREENSDTKIWQEQSEEPLFNDHNNSNSIFE